MLFVNSICKYIAPVEFCSYLNFVNIKALAQNILRKKLSVVIMSDSATSIMSISDRVLTSF